ncbi:MAG: VWA domain-containing protein [Planctomycetes bacterium]|nr:VWA domain-containing protein [Planctomycetota bacterium]
MAPAFSSSTHAHEGAPASTAALPGWLASCVLHGAMLALLLTAGIPSCTAPADVSGEEAGDFRQVGIHLKQPTSQPDRPQDEPSEDDAAQAQRQAVETPDAVAADEAPPVPLSLPDVSVPRLGPGAAAPVPVASVDVRELARPSGVRRPGGASGVGPGEVEFFGARDRATQVVYVLDCSGSMSGTPLQEAKARLLASLERLEQTQRFQVVFYSDSALPLRLTREAKPELYWASDINRTLAKQQILGIRAFEAGTWHMKGLSLALEMKPEVVFLLTDGQTGIGARELNEIRTRNQGRTHIHTIEFGDGPQLTSAGSFLKTLAAQNGGTYRYQDVTRFGER